MIPSLLKPQIMLFVALLPFALAAPIGDEGELAPLPTAVSLVVCPWIDALGGRATSAVLALAKGHERGVLSCM